MAMFTDNKYNIFEHFCDYGNAPRPERIPSISAQMTIVIESYRKWRALILRKAIIPRPTPISRTGAKDAAFTIICASIKPDTERATREPELANKK